MKFFWTLGSSSFTHRALASVLALLLIWTGVAAAVQIPGKAVETGGAAVPNAKFVAVIDDGETSALRVTRSRGRISCSHPSWGDLFEVPSFLETFHSTGAPVTSLYTRSALEKFADSYLARTARAADPSFSVNRLIEENFAQGLNSASYLRDNWTIQARLDYNWPNTSYGGSPITNLADGAGKFTVDTDQFAQLGNQAYKAGDKVRMMAGMSCEGALKLFQEPATSWDEAFPYSDYCPKYCVIKWSQPQYTSPEKCSETQLPAEIVPAQYAGGTSSPAAGGDPMTDQWAFKKLGLPLDLPWERLAPITVAVIDSGLDYRHPAFKPANLWVNREPGFDRAYPDDVMGWNYILGHNNPWDDLGHGTFVAGLVLAVNPRARIMPIKVMDGFGGGLNSDIGAAVIYAVDRGARVINLSVGTKGLTQLHQDVVDYARSRGVVLVAAAGNEGVNVDDYTPGGVKGVLTVAALDQNDKKPVFGNWGQNVALAAPGVDIVSWRAKSSDLVLVFTSGKNYQAGDNIVASNKWLYRASGTSFAAPFVAGAAALLLALNPNLTGKQVERMLVESADDVEVAGWDQITGAGRLNIARAVFSNPDVSLVAKVARIEPGQLGGQPAVQVFGTAEGSALKSYQVQIGRGEAPSSWKTVAVQTDKEVDNGLLAAFPLREITARGKWSVRVIVQDVAGRTREARGSLDIN